MVPTEMTTLDAPTSELTYENIPFTDETFPIRILLDMTTTASATAQRNGHISWHEQLEILYVLEGQLICECDFRRYVCRAGDIIMINPCEAHAISFADAPARYHCVMIDLRLCGCRDDRSIRDFIDPIAARRVRFHNHLGNCPWAREILGDMIAEFCDKQAGYELAVRGDLLRLLSLLYRYEVTGDAPSVHGVKDAIAPALRYIADHYVEEIALSRLAGECCMNESYFCRRFREFTGRTAMTYVSEYRLAKAKALLLTTVRSITDIAAATGFNDSGYFTRKFKELYGLSPSAMRKGTVPSP